MSQRRIEGLIIRYNPDRGFGFIAVDDTRYFMHATQLPGNCDRENLAGRRVSFIPGETGKGPAAYRVEFVEGEGDEA